PAAAAGTVPPAATATAATGGGEESAAPAGGVPAAPAAAAEASSFSPVTATAENPAFSAPIAVTPGAALAAAPAETLTDQTELGPLPRLSKTGIKPWIYYGRDYARSDKPMIAVMVTGLGFNRKMVEDAVRLPPAISLAFSPYGPSGNIWAAAARAAGHEIFIELPAEPADYPASDPGPHGLLTSNNPQENLTRLRWVMTRMPGYVGLYLPPQERLTANADAAAPLLQFIASRGVMLVLGAATLPEAAERLLTTLVLPVVRADIYSGEESTVDFSGLLLQLEDLAHRNGRALLVVQASPGVFKVLGDWAQRIEEKGYSLAPVSALARIPNS
ncbi:MAG: divergent polysaccharide deacetylase family protein, partial [Alphaproteobacteria bacterium]|nr:divergent polysaccharide deacetylase family protein [Alphaproteobacteria bacterium]